MVRWNPNSPEAIGLEWHPAYMVKVPMTVPTQVEGWRLDSTVTETIKAVWPYISDVSGSVNESYQVEIYKNGVFPSYTISTISVRPSDDSLNLELGARGWDGSVASTSNLFDKIDNTTQVPVALPGGSGLQADDDFIYGGFGGGYQVAFRFDGLAAALAGKHIIRVRLSARVQPYNLSGGQAAMTVTPYMTIGGRQYYGAARSVAGTVAGGHLVQFNWDINPATLRSWLPSELGGFDQGVATADMGWLVSGTNSSRLLPTILQGWVDIEHAGTDLREALGAAPAASMSGSSMLEGWYRIGLVRPNGTTGWAKLMGTAYRLTYRRMSQVPGGISASYRYLFGESDPLSVNGWSKLDMTYRSYFNLPVAAAAVNDGDAYGPAFILDNEPAPSVPFPSDDSQPYAVLDYRTGVEGSGYTNDNEGIYITNPQRQLFDTPAVLTNANFSLISLLIKRESITELTGDLTLTIHRASDDVQIGGVGTLTEADFDELIDDNPLRRSEWTEARVVLASTATLSPSTSYYVAIESIAASGSGWLIQVPLTQRAEDLYLIATDASIDPLYRTGSGVDVTNGNAALTVLSVPLPPQNVAVVAIDDVNVPCRQLLQLTWDPPPTDFISYEAQRAESSSGPWSTVIRSDGTSVEDYEDDECRLNQATYYRMRTVRADGSVSDWSDVVSATASMDCCGYVFSSNGAPTMSVYADDESRDGSRDVSYPENVEVKEFYGRDYRVVFQELEWRGAEFTRQLLIAATPGATLDATPAPVADGAAAFTPLHRLARASFGLQLPYVCVRNERGDRWFASLQTPSTTEYQSPDLYLATVKVVEVTATPAVSTLFRCTTVEGVDIILLEDNCALLFEDNGHIMLEDQ